MQDLEEVARIAIDCGFHLHKALGPGLLESVYETVLADALERRGLHAERQKALDFVFEGKVFREGFRIDLLVEGRLIIELKSVERLPPRPRQAVADLSPPRAAAPRAAHELRRGDIQGGAAYSRRGCIASSTGMSTSRLRAFA
jgi:GxxExxY protein